MDKNIIYHPIGIMRQPQRRNKDHDCKTQL